MWTNKILMLVRYIGVWRVKRSYHGSAKLLHKENFLKTDLKGGDVKAYCNHPNFIFTAHCSSHCERKSSNGSFWNVQSHFDI